MKEDDDQDASAPAPLPQAQGKRKRKKKKSSRRPAAASSEDNTVSEVGGGPLPLDETWLVLERVRPKHGIISSLFFVKSAIIFRCFIGYSTATINHNLSSSPRGRGR